MQPASKSEAAHANYANPITQCLFCEIFSQISPWPCWCWGPPWGLEWPQKSTQMVGWARKKFEMTNFTVPYNVSSMIGALRSVPGFADMMLGSSMGTGMASEASRGLRFGKGCMCIPRRSMLLWMQIPWYQFLCKNGQECKGLWHNVHLWSPDCIKRQFGIAALGSPIQKSNGSKSGPRRKHCYKTSKFVKMHQERGFLLANAWGGETGDMSSSSSWRLNRLVGDHLGKRWFHRSQGSSSSSGQGKSSRFRFQDNKSRCVKRKFLAQILCSFSSLLLPAEYNPLGDY